MRPLILIFLLALYVVTVNGSCPSGQLSCDDGEECITSSSWCDKQDDCIDKSDEKYCKRKSFWNSNPNDCESSHFLCNDGRCVPKSAKCNGHSDCKDGSDEDYCEKLEEKSFSEESKTSSGKSKTSSEESKTSSEESKTSSEESKTSSEESKTSSEKSKTSSEEDKTSSEETKTSSKEDKTSSKETKTSSEENESDKKDLAGTLSLDRNNYDEETPNLRTTQSIPSTKTVAPSFYATNSYYDRRLNGENTQTPRNVIYSFNNQGQYYPPPPPTYPKITPYNPSYSRTTQPTPNINRRPSNPPGSHRQTTFNAPGIHGQPARFPQNVHRQPSNYNSDPYRQSTNYNSDPNRQSTNYNSNPNRQSTNYNSDPNRQSTNYNSNPNKQSTNYNSDPYRQSTNYNSNPNRQSTNYNYDPNRHSTYYSPNGRSQQPTYPHPTPRSTRYNNFHENANPPSDGLPDFLSRHVPRYTGHRNILPGFNFSRDFSTAKNDESVFRGVEWILSRREPYRGWGADTPRAIVALSLANGSFENDGSLVNDGMKNYLNLQVGLKLLDAQNLRETELAHIVLALLATCQDPSDFQGVDLGRTLLEKGKTQHPFTLLTACLAGQPLWRSLNSLINNVRATPDSEKKKDRLILSISALSCHLKSNPSDQTRLAETLQNATSKLLQLKLDDGSFGSVYSTAMAAQALMSLDNNTIKVVRWNPDPTFSFLRERQNINGSFGYFLATYLVIPTLSGRSLLHLRNTQCRPKNEELTPQEILEYPGEKQYLKYYLNFGYPLTNAYSVQMHVPREINFFDVMRVAEYQNKHFSFQYDKREEKINVYSISDVPNDVERGLAWHLYRKNYSHFEFVRINEDVKNIFPRPNDEYIFWYHHVGLTLQLH